jgi:Histidine kinase
MVRKQQLQTRTGHIAMLADRADLLAAKQAESEHRATLAERLRIAREMHDIVAHHISVVVIQSQAAQRVADADPARAKTAMADVEHTSRTALEEMRRLLGLLRSGEPAAGREAGTAGQLAGTAPIPDSTYVPPSGLADIDILAERLRQAGLDITIVRKGESAGVPDDLGLTVYRIVQESLTNVLKHAGPAVVTVELEFTDRVDVTITDDGRGASAALTAIPGAGRGMAGMRERVAALGGTFTAGPLLELFTRLPTWATAVVPPCLSGLTSLAAAPLVRLPGRAGRIGRLARGNTIRNPKRTSATAAALMIGLAVITGTSVLVSSARATIGQQITAASRTQFYVQATNGSTGISPRLAGTIGRQPGVQAVTEVRQTGVTVAGTANRDVDGVDPSVISQFTRPRGDRRADLRAQCFRHDDGVVQRGVGQRLEDRRHGPGAVRRLRGLPAARRGDLRQCRPAQRLPGQQRDPRRGQRHPDRHRGPGPGAGLRPRLDPGRARRVPRRAASGPERLHREPDGLLNSLLTLVTAMLILAIVIALLGVVNTLALSIAERTRENRPAAGDRHAARPAPAAGGGRVDDHLGDRRA